MQASDSETPQATVNVFVRTDLLPQFLHVAFFRHGDVSRHLMRKCKRGFGNELNVHAGICQQENERIVIVYTNFQIALR